MYFYLTISVNVDLYSIFMDLNVKTAELTFISVEKNNPRKICHYIFLKLFLIGNYKIKIL